MKKVRTVICVILIACLGFGWVLAFSGNISDGIKYKKAIKQAQEYTNKELYQKAIFQYEEALKLKEKLSTRKEMLNAYKLGLDEGVISKSKYENVYSESCNLYPNEEELWENIILYYIENRSLSKGYDTYNQAKKSGAKSDKLTEYGKTLKYTYRVNSANYTDVSRSPNGVYTLKYGDFWGVIQGGENFASFSYKYISPENSKMEALLVSEKGNRIFDSNAIVQSKISKAFDKTKAFGCGFLPVKVSKTEWQYYDCENDLFVFDKYEDVSAFSNDKAFVKTDGKWICIDNHGNKIENVEFSDINLYDNGEYLYSNVMIASIDGKYKMYDAQFKEKNDFSATQMDNYYGGYIAFKGDNDLWGYVDLKGIIIFEPQFEEAKSFSQGLGAVAKLIDVEQEAEKEETVSENEDMTEKASNEETKKQTSVKEKRWGFIDASNTLVIEHKFYDAGYFDDAGSCLVADFFGSYYFIQLQFV